MNLIIKNYNSSATNEQQTKNSSFVRKVFFCFKDKVNRQEEIKK